MRSHIVFTPNTNGAQNLGSTSTRWGTLFSVNNPDVSSDERIKKEISNLNMGLDFIENVRAKQYKLDLENVDNKFRFGFIAQDVIQYLNKNGFDCCNSTFVNKCEENEYMSLQYEQTIPILTNAIRELNEKVKLLESKLLQFN